MNENTNIGAAHSLRVGDRAPEFELPSVAGGTVRLSDFRGRSAVVLFFYPKDGTAVCTAEACAFRDAYEEFRSGGAEVIGISSDSLAAHRRFTDRHGLPYLLLSDADGAVRALYGVRPTLWVIPGRSTFLIDNQGVVRHIFSGLLVAQKHVDEARRVLAELKTETWPGNS